MISFPNQRQAVKASAKFFLITAEARAQSQFRILEKCRWGLSFNWVKWWSHPHQVPVTTPRADLLHEADDYLLQYA